MAKLPKMTPEMVKEEKAFYEQELKEFNDRARRMRKSGRGMTDDTPTPPPLNKDGSLKKDEDESDG